jgi:type II secretory pathway component PulC
LGFRDGDVILDIGGREPQSPEHAFRILGSFAPGESLRVSIMRKQARQTLEISIPGDASADSA